MIRFVVHGKAAPAGSKRAFVQGGRAQVVDANKNAKPWKNQVAAAALDAYTGPLLDQPLVVNITETRIRPKSHYRTNGQLNKKGRATPYPVGPPDTGKIARGIHDALEGVLYRNDSLIVDGWNAKVWGDREHTEITVIPLADGDQQALDAA